MGESTKSIRLYCGIVGVAALYSGMFGVRRLFGGLTRVLTYGAVGPWWFASLQFAGPALRLAAGLLLLYMAWQLPSLLARDLKAVRTLFVTIAAIIAAHGLIDAAAGFLPAFGTSALGLVIIWYLYGNAKRLAPASGAGSQALSN